LTVFQPFGMDSDFVNNMDFQKSLLFLLNLMLLQLC
jgi:hypothetical protein